VCRGIQIDRRLVQGEDDEPPVIWGQSKHHAKGEMVHAHPGDTEPAENGKRDLVVTKAAIGLRVLKFFGSNGEDVVTMRSSYPCQFFLCRLYSSAHVH
jgi:hypothetical protein